MNPLATLTDQLIAAGLPVVGLSIIPAGTAEDPAWIVATCATGERIRIDMTSPTPLQIATAQAMVGAFSLTQLKLRSLLAILTDIQALTGTQQTAIWNDLTGGAEPKKWKTMSSDQCVWAKGSQATTSLLEKQVAVAFFVRENTGYLVHPSFDNTINVPGTEPA